MMFNPSGVSGWYFRRRKTGTCSTNNAIGASDDGESAEMCDFFLRVCIFFSLF
jgi:hypothetical protein